MTEVQVEDIQNDDWDFVVVGVLRNEDLVRGFERGSGRLVASRPSISEFFDFGKHGASRDQCLLRLEHLLDRLVDFCLRPPCACGASGARQCPLQETASGSWIARDVAGLRGRRARLPGG